MIYEKGYKPVLGFECLSACISGYLYNKGYHIDGSTIFFVGNGFRIEYNKRNKILKANVHNCNFDFLNKYDISYLSGIFRSESDALVFLEQCIKKEKQICIRVSTDMLTYNRVYKQAKAANHYINIIGEMGDSYYISDGYVPLYSPTVYYGWVLKSDIIKAWRKNDYFYITISDIKARINEDLIYCDVKNKIKEGIINYLSSTHEGYDYGIVYGADATKCFFQELNFCVEDDIDLRKLALDINYNLKLYGIISYREMLLNELYRIKINDLLLIQYTDIVERWKRSCLMLLKIGISNKRQDMCQFIRKCELLSVQEVSVLECLLEILTIRLKSKI